MSGRGLLGLAAAAALSAAPAGAEPTLVAYLPGAPVESAARLGAALEELGGYLRARVPGLALAVRPFRRSGDALAFVRGSEDSVAALLVDRAFLLDLPPELRILPTHRFVRSGSETGRKLVVVHRDSAAVATLADLKGRSIAVAQSAAEGGALYLAEVVFGGEVAPRDWFGEVREEADEFTATANVLYGRTDAALVSEENPLLAAHLGAELRAIYSSEPLSLPVLALRDAALGPEQQQVLDAALASLPSTREGAAILEGLGIDGFAPVADGGARHDRAALLALPQRVRRALEIAAAPGGELGLEPLPAPSPEQLAFQLGLELSEPDWPSDEPVPAGGGGVR